MASRKQQVYEKAVEIWGLGNAYVASSRDESGKKLCEVGFRVAATRDGEVRRPMARAGSWADVLKELEKVR